MGMKKAVFKEIRQMESTVEASQSVIGDGSRVRFRRSFDSCESSFLFLIVFYL
jgi:hypothetical protein